MLADGARLAVTVDGDDPRRFLTAMLERIQAEMRERGRHPCTPRTPKIPHMF